MSATHKEAVAFLESIFGEAHTSEQLEDVLLSCDGNVDRTIEALLADDDRDPEALVSWELGGKSCAESDKNFIEISKREDSEHFHGNMQAKKVKGTEDPNSNNFLVSEDIGWGNAGFMKKNTSKSMKEAVLKQNECNVSKKNGPSTKSSGVAGKDRTRRGTTKLTKKDIAEPTKVVVFTQNSDSILRKKTQAPKGGKRPPGSKSKGHGQLPLVNFSEEPPFPEEGNEDQLMSWRCNEANPNPPGITVPPLVESGTDACHNIQRRAPCGDQSEDGLIANQNEQTEGEGRLEADDSSTPTIPIAKAVAVDKWEKKKKWLIVVLILAIAGLAAGLVMKDSKNTSTTSGTTLHQENTTGQEQYCILSQWSSWSNCSVPCGRGEKTRTRTIEVANSPHGTPCPPASSLEDTQDCNSDPCPGDCQLSPWSPWSKCSKECGFETQHRTRHVVSESTRGGASCPSDSELEETRDCNIPPCPGGCEVSSWSDWSECSAPCGGGRQNRTRTIVSQPDPGGDPCPPESSFGEVQECNTHCCPVDCALSDWSAWSDCSKDCGGGTQFRSRSISVQAQCNGTLCPPESDLKQTQIVTPSAAPLTACCPHGPIGLIAQGIAVEGQKLVLVSYKHRVSAEESHARQNLNWRTRQNAMVNAVLLTVSQNGPLGLAATIAANVASV
eukprot:CAMPEP_0197448634 /NCGR_PEP_ID=MMETSP1175-20131217/18259_1 /TAXON_ID=1003142 /ORGANISM="Triceratium dubium, Strain CCMP147" /LENGTH=668 /DNA_ID=CAMNT_0042980463 /DNA_START=584 /DNA_END=2591 /DNA_ORIENTATION=-